MRALPTLRASVVVHRTRRRRALRRRVLWTGGELLVTVGLALLLLVVHEVWWTDREARQGAEREVEALEREWGTAPTTGTAPTAGTAATAGAAATGRADTGGAGDGSGAPAASEMRRRGGGPQDEGFRQLSPARSQAYAVLVVPRLHLRVPVAEGVDKAEVLNKGYVGHYPGTQQPGQAGNFAVAGHRNTHGEPFRYLNRLRVKDVVQVETGAAVYTYAVDQVLPETSARDSGVVRPVPRSVVKPAYGYGDPGYYLTLTTCTPEYTSRYRLVVWGKLLSMRPR
ncbi:class E sortase [Streptomyces sp. NPDC058960]|uniref:class E sortase n=1 Tax=Streptomyces sp. NPDC058960 TaxID=3346679 RepID=UPI0036D009B0